MAAGPETVTKIETKGLVDAVDRIMRELIRTPKFKEGIVILLSSIDPPSARSLVRTLFWQDPGLLMSVMGSLPALINLAAEALAEVAAQMASMPTPLLQDFLDVVAAGIDGSTAGEAAGGLVGMVLSLGLADKDGGLSRSLSSLGEDFGRAYSEAAGQGALTARLDAWMARAAARARDKDSATHAFVQSASKALKNNPDFVDGVLKPLLAPALKEAARKGAAPARKPAKPKQERDK